MKITAIKLKVYLLETIAHRDVLSAVATFVDKAICDSAKWEEMHIRNTFKPYICSGLAPVEKDRSYKKGHIYTFTLRTLDQQLAQYLSEKLPHIETSHMKGLVNEVWAVSRKPISKLYSLTPAILKCEGVGYWKGHLSFEQYQDRIRVNLIKKYNYFQDTKLDESFELWHHFEILNENPIAVPYKGIQLLGDKVEFQVAHNEIAQQLAYMSLATGLGELGARNFGYVNYHTVKEV